ncbi:uncharacterized protein LOC135812534 isoform X1 [Sycon ciliatum]|uniref:uncharacterized protein LOC135812534 isoform X1 n=1 Tax=Sycon ciliatum TaxID=27933 RepID=UPI0031F5F4A8
MQQCTTTGLQNRKKLKSKSRALFATYTIERLPWYTLQRERKCEGGLFTSFTCSFLSRVHVRVWHQEMADGDPADCGSEDLDYTVHLFGYHPQRAIDGVLDIVDSVTEDGVAGLKATITEKQDLSADVVSTGCEQYQRRLEDFASVLYGDVFREFAEGILSIPSHVVLPEHAGKNGHREDQRADCLQLAKQIEQEKYDQLALKERIRQLEEAEAKAAALQRKVDSIGSTPDELLKTKSQATQLLRAFDSLEADS